MLVSFYFLLCYNRTTVCPKLTYKSTSNPWLTVTPDPGVARKYETCCSQTLVTQDAVYCAGFSALSHWSIMTCSVRRVCMIDAM